MQIKINDVAFYGDKSMSKYFKPSFFEWYRGPGLGDGNLVFYTDSCMWMVDMPQYRHSKNIALMIEPNVIQPMVHEWIVKNYHKFDYVLTHHRNLLNLDKRFIWYPNAMSWVGKENWEVYAKSKDVSIIASDKNYAPGHQLRHFVVKNLLDNKVPIEICGKGYRPIPEKLEALKDYRFSIAIENCREPGYFSEKLIDCFGCGTIPIYWGDPTIGKIFNEDGIILINEVNHVSVCKEITSNAKEIYESKIEAVKENFKVAHDYRVAEDYIFINILNELKLV